MKTLRFTILIFAGLGSFAFSNLVAQTVAVPGGYSAIVTSTNNVGIGTTSPAEGLTLGTGYNLQLGASDAAGGALLLRRGFGSSDPAVPGASGAIFYDHNGGTLGNNEAMKFIGEEFRFRQSTGGNDMLTIKTNGYVGIGTTNLFRPLTVEAGSAAGINRGLVINSAHAYGVGEGTAAGALVFARNRTTDTGLLNVSAQVIGGNELETTSDYGYLAFHTTDGASISQERLRINSAGNVGIGTTSPGSRRLYIETTSSDNDVGAQIHIGNTTGTNYGLAVQADGVGASLNQGIFTTASGGTTNYGLRLYNVLSGANNYALYSDSAAQSYFQGNVGIGTTNPTHKLAVNGTVRAKEVIVDTGWADYVLKPDYRLAPLSEVEAHINAHGTLPGVPSEAEIAKEGVSLGDMQVKLLAKMEELTLHVIRQEKELAGQRATLAAQAAEIAALKSANAASR